MKNKSIVIGLVIVLVSVLASPVSAWGELTHNAITSRLTGVPNQVLTYPSYVRGGDVGPDMFDFLPGSEGYSNLAHTQKTADLVRNMLNISSKDWEKAFAYGWLSHDVSDIIGHRDYVNIIAGAYSVNPTLIEIGGDANVASSASTSFSVPYDLVQRAYGNTYGAENTPSLDTIKFSVKAQQSAIYIEKLLISFGLFNNLKITYGKPNFWSNYSKSIAYTKFVMNDPFNNSIFNNTNLITGYPIAGTSILISSDISKVGYAGIDKDIRDTSNELLTNGIIDVKVKDDKKNKILTVEEPVIKDKKKFNEAIEKLIKLKEDKK